MIDAESRASHDGHHRLVMPFVLCRAPVTVSPARWRTCQRAPSPPNLLVPRQADNPQQTAQRGAVARSPLGSTSHRTTVQCRTDANWILNPDTYDPFDFIGPNGLRGFVATVGVFPLGAATVWFGIERRARQRPLASASHRNRVRLIKLGGRARKIDLLGYRPVTRVLAIDG